MVNRLIVHGYSLVHNSELVDGPFATLREVKAARDFYLTDPGWSHYYPKPEMLEIVTELKESAPGKPKGGRTWKQVLRP